MEGALIARLNRLERALTREYFRALTWRHRDDPVLEDMARRRRSVIRRLNDRRAESEQREQRGRSTATTGPVRWGLAWCPSCGDGVELLAEIEGDRAGQPVYGTPAGECRPCGLVIEEIDGELRSRPWGAP